MIEQTEINEGDTIRSVRIYEKNNPLLEFELFKEFYVADWFSGISQSKFFAILKRLNYPMNALTVVQSKKKYPEKTIDVKLKEVLNLKEKIYFFDVYTPTEKYAIAWHNYKGRIKRLEFASYKKNLDILVDLLNNTSKKNLGDKIKLNLEKVLEDYKE